MVEIIYHTLSKTLQYQLNGTEGRQGSNPCLHFRKGVKMPNWCKGTLKVRGKVKDLKRFVLEGLEPVGYLGDSKEQLKFNEFDYLETKHHCHIENTHRGFVCEDQYIELYKKDEETQVICLDSEFAWGIDAKQLLKTCKKYNVDMKIHAFERGMEFNQEIEIVNGQIIKDNKIKFDDYEWECICPNIGG